MFKKLLAWFSAARPSRRRGLGESCTSCRYFIDYTEPPDDMLGYCSFDYVNKNTWNEYGGHWTHAKEWCREWEGGEPYWRRNDEPKANDGILPARTKKR